MDENQNNQPNLPHTPGEVINPGIQQTADNAANNTAVQTPPQPSTEPGTTQPFLLRDVPEQKDRKKLVKRLAIPTVVFVILLIGFGMAINQGILMPNRLKTVSYDNGKSASFKLKFYAAHKTQPLNSKFSDTDNKTQFLIGQNGKAGKLPLSVAVFSGGGSGTLKAAENNSKCGSSGPAFTVYNDYAGKDVNVCSWLNEGSVDYIEMASFTKNGKVVIALFMQDADWSASKSKQSAQELLKKTGLQPYEDDIKQIVASIRPTN